MGVQTARRWCPEDGKWVLATRQTPNHVLHLLLSVITLGVWVVVWFLAAVVAGSRAYRCPHCGARTKWFKR